MDAYSMNISGFVQHGQVTLLEALSSTILSIPVIACSALGALMSITTVCILIKEKVWQIDNRNIFLLNLVLASLFGSLAFGNLGLVLTGSITHQSCLVFFYAMQWSYMTSWMSLVVIMLDQYLCIEWPLKYPIWMTPNATKTLITGTWMLPVINFCLFKWAIDGEKFCDYIPGNEDIFSFGIYTLMILAGIPLPIMILINLRILFIAKRRANEVNLIHVTSLSGSIPKEPQGSRRTFVQLWKSILTATIIVGAMAVSVMPYTVLVARMVANPPTALSQMKQMVRDFLAGTTLMGISFTVNPLIFSMRVPQVKKFYATIWRKLVSKCFCRS